MIDALANGLEAHTSDISRKDGQDSAPTTQVTCIQATEADPLVSTSSVDSDAELKASQKFTSKFSGLGGGLRKSLRSTLKRKRKKSMQEATCNLASSSRSCTQNAEIHITAAKSLSYTDHDGSPRGLSISSVSSVSVSSANTDGAYRCH